MYEIFFMYCTKEVEKLLEAGGQNQMLLFDWHVRLCSQISAIKLLTMPLEMMAEVIKKRLVIK